MKSRKFKLPGLFLFYSFLPYKLVKILKRLFFGRLFCCFIVGFVLTRWKVNIYKPNEAVELEKVL